jgi:hypothetical protein
MLSGWTCCAKLAGGKVDSATKTAPGSIAERNLEKMERGL